MASFFEDLLVAAVAVAAVYATGGAAAGAVGAFFTGGAALGTYLQAGLVLYGMYQSHAVKGGSSEMFPGQQVTIRATDAARWQVFGRTIPPVGLLYWFVHPGNSQYFTVVLDVAHHEIDGFEEFFINGESVGALGTGVWDGVSQGGCVQPGSKWSRHSESLIPARVTWPAIGGTVTIGGTISAVASVVANVDTADTIYAPLHEGIDYSRSGSVFTALNDTYSGREVTITYRTESDEPFVRIRTWNGAETGYVDDVLIADSGGVWTADHKRCGVASMAVTFKWDVTLFGSIGLPEVKARIRGKKIKIFGGGETLYWTSNAAAIQAHYLTDQRYGFGFPESEVNADTVIAAMNACNELVPIDSAGTTQYRYTIDGTIMSDQPLFDNLRTMLGASVGSASFSANEWRLFAGVYQDPVLTLEDSDYAIGDKLAEPFTTGRNNFNAVRGRFVDPANVYQSNDFPPYVSSLYYAEDGGAAEGDPVFHEIDLPLTTDGMRAQRIAKQALFRTRNNYTFSAAYTMKAFPLQPLDGVYLRHVRRGWDTMNSGAGKRFFVKQRALQPPGTVPLTLTEDAPEFYLWDFNEATSPDPAPNIALPDPAYVEAVGHPRANTGPTTFVIEGGVVVPCMNITWDAITDKSITQIVIQSKLAWETEFREQIALPQFTQFVLAPVAAGEIINLQIFARNSIGAESRKAFITHVCSDDLPSYGTSSASANWITNSLFRSGVVGWHLFKNGAARAAFFKPVLADQWLGGSFDASPANAVLYNPDPFPIGASPPQLMTNPAPVTPGQGVGAMMSVLPVQCDVSIGLLFLDANSAATGYFTSDETVIDHMNPVARTDPRQRGNYDTTRVWAEAPANSVAVRAFLTMTGPLRGTAECAVYITEPLLGPCLQGDLAGLKWTPGGQGSVGTAVMEVNATNIMYRPQTAIPNAVTTTTSEVSDILMRFTPTEDGQLEVVYECECASQTINGEYTLVAGFSITGVSEAVGAPVIVSAPVLTTPATANQLAEPKGMTRKATFTAVNGQEIVITHYMQRVVTVEYASSKLGIAYTPTSGKRFNGKDAFSDRRLSALLMPRTTAILAAA